MSYRRIKIGDVVEQHRQICFKDNLTPDDVWGISARKEFFSPARQIGQDTSGYKIVPEGFFACNLLHVGRDKVLPVALNSDNTSKIVSSNYYVFKFIVNPYIIKEFFFLLLSSAEMDRYFSYYTEASVRDRLDWKTFCNTEWKVPPVELQEKIVEFFLSLSRNISILKKYNNTLKRLIYLLLEEKIANAQEFELGEFVKISEETNFENKFGEDDLYGISIEKEFCRSMTDIKKVNLSNFYLVKPKYFAYNEITSRNKERLSVAFNTTGKNILVSNRYKVFKVKSDKITEEFLYLYMAREEFDRYARYHSWGGAREMFLWNDFLQTKIPLPQKEEQKMLSDLFYISQFKKKQFECYEKMTKNFCSFVFKKYCT